VHFSDADRKEFDDMLLKDFLIKPLVCKKLWNCTDKLDPKTAKVVKGVFQGSGEKLPKLTYGAVAQALYSYWHAMALQGRSIVGLIEARKRQ
jgi:hypothetical protein